ncbi:MAG: glyoxylate/hydroxypyruvate reductase A [Oxalobacter sp.]|nr:MAG: glyoxylate/hydroxypyruvate reductase A [Oxalobacter sp.]
MKVIYYNEGEDNAFWLAGLRAALPQAEFRLWLPGDEAPADYALVWDPPKNMLAGRKGLKAIVNLGAGVDKLLQMGDALPDVPILRLEDAGMAVQMAEYATYAVLRHFRRFDEYDRQAQRHEWQFLPSNNKRDFTVGIMGLGAIGKRIAQSLLHFGFPVRGWSRTRKAIQGVHCFAGTDGLEDFLQDVRALICVLPLTAETTSILNQKTFNKLAFGAYLINIARGKHLVEDDLLAALSSGRIAGATLDVFQEEPLPPGHPFWSDPRIAITPHMAGETFRDDTVRQVVEKLHALERGEAISGIVNRKNGY